MLLGRPSSSVVLYAAVTLLLAFNGLYLLVHFFGNAGAAPAPGSAIEYPLYGTLIAFGDSITEGGSSAGYRGFVARLADIYTRRLDVLNRGFSGYTSRDALSVAPMVFPTMPLQRKSRLAVIQRALGLTPAPEDLMFPERPQPPHLCLIFFGTNDARAAPNAQHVPLEDFRANIRRLVALLRDPASAHYSPKTRILLITPPAVGDRMMDELARRDGRHPGWRNAVTKHYAQAVMEAAEEAKLPAIDLWTWIEDLVHGNAATDGLSFRVNAEGNFTATDFGAGGLDAASEPSPFEGYERFLSDGLHLNAGGNELLYRLIIAKIRDAWPELSPRMKPATKPQLVAHV
ncbi:isoamyl acetate-hydrolyzing esterase [Coemansia helicoidea]|uniref:Isoamyl acetate-hydrolyzing esterase n=1 Tax=Coemansia helicoidea TaxID=1286919 RepID=A0ACC1L0P8_9FUNG|nr:isoamyl acetate-hydrolyzing esterase [Coemansia helicoidea]